jgi:hypothetical protein
MSGCEHSKESTFVRFIRTWLPDGVRRNLGIQISFEGRTSKLLFSTKSSSSSSVNDNICE